MTLTGAVAAVSITTLRTASARAICRAFAAWGRGKGSIYDLMDADAQIVISGTSPHCGTFSKAAFLREVAGPFMARFAEPPVPQLRTLLGNVDSVVVLADATGTTRDGQAYANDYVFVFEMAGRRVTRVVEFLDMAAFNAVWDRVEPAPIHAR
ncbi:nuclear transport factor 2 family protein [Lichenicoccus sp.]|uniref:nuclear transport factor 2 family protein n=1 Tax=Lichenicoccus sp. TaxID=2781899 RepID=UPI003D0AE8F7